MSKIIKVESCGECPYKISAGIYYRCPKLMNYKSAKDTETIKDLSKILPNCPLEDYPEAKKKDIQELRKNFIELQEHMICMDAEIMEFEK